MKTLECKLYKNVIGFKPDTINLKFKYIKDLGNSTMEIVFADDECILDKIITNKKYAGLAVYTDDKNIIYIFNNVIFSTDIFVGIEYCKKMEFKYDFYEKRTIN